jgi:peptidase inhibitor family I36
MRKTLKRLAVAAVALVSIAGLGIAAAPAQAASLSNCPSSVVCLWNGTNWSGTPAWTQNIGAFGSCYNVSAINGANNNAESLVNKESFQVSFYSGTSGSGYLFSIAAGAGESDLSVHPSPGGFQNIISSVCHE